MPHTNVVGWYRSLGETEGTADNISYRRKNQQRRKSKDVARFPKNFQRIEVKEADVGVHGPRGKLSVKKDWEKTSNMAPDRRH